MNPWYRKRMFSGLFISHALDLEICVIMGKCNTLEIPLDDAVVGQELHNGQDGTRDKTKRISLSLPSPGEDRSNIPKVLLRQLVPRSGGAD